MVQEKKITGKVAKSSAVVPAKSGSVMTVKKKFVKKETNDDKVKRSLRASTTEGCFNAASGSITSTFITPLALAPEGGTPPQERPLFRPLPFSPPPPPPPGGGADAL